MKFEFTRRASEGLVTTVENRELEDVRKNLDRIAMEKDYVYSFEELTYTDGRICFTLRDRQEKIISQWKQIEK